MIRTKTSVRTNNPYDRCLFCLAVLLFVNNVSSLPCLQHTTSVTFRDRKSSSNLENQSRVREKIKALQVRGGSAATEEFANGNTEEDEDGDVTDTAEGEEEDDEEDESEDLWSPVMSAPVRLVIVTNWGNSVLDHRVELMAARTRNVASLKQSISRQLPGRPPVLGLELVWEGTVLDDETIVEELFDDEDEDDDDDDDDDKDADGIDGPSKTLILNVVPPVDPKFATELGTRLATPIPEYKESNSNDDSLSTEELVEAYFLNQAAMVQNANLLGNPSVPMSPMVRLEAQMQTRRLRESFQKQIPDSVWEASVQSAYLKNHNAAERRGQRYRSGKGGAVTNLKKSLQHNLNINWAETIRNFLLFLFFGYFGGRNTLSRSLMLWGAPLCFILQTRPAKLRSKQLFYMLQNPPGILLSLLPAPQQLILSISEEKAYSDLYGTVQEEDKTEAQKVAAIAAAATKKSHMFQQERDEEDNDDSDEVEESESNDESDDEPEIELDEDEDDED